MIAAAGVCEINLVESKTLPMFVMPNSVDESVNHYKYYSSLIKASFLRRFYVSSFALFGDIQGGLASFIIHIINQIFGPKMPNSDKNLNRQAKGMHGSTPSTRNSAHRAKSCTIIIKRLRKENNRLKEECLIEQRAKNQAYCFILASHHLARFIEFSAAYSGQGDLFEDRLSLIINSTSPEK